MGGHHSRNLQECVAVTGEATTLGGLTKDQFLRSDSDDTYASGNVLTISGKTVEATTTFADGDTTPSVSAGNKFLTANTGATSITTFDDGAANQTIRITAGDALTSLVHGATLVLQGGITGVAQGPFSQNSVFEFETKDGTTWVEVNRDVK